MVRNRVKHLVEQNKPAYGTYITFPTSAAVETVAIAGLDFVRIDGYKASFNNETLQDMIQTAYAHDVTPWLRVKNDPWSIMTILDLGTQAITIPNIGSAAAARAAVDAAFYPPKGDREMSRPLRFRTWSAPDYIEWANNEVLLACQIEGRDGIENYKEIVKVEGLDIVQTGRGDLSLALGVPGQIFHPKVLETEERIVDAALEAGKQVSLKQSLNDEGFEYVRKWLDRGILIHTIDSEYQVMLDAYLGTLGTLRG